MPKVTHCSLKPRDTLQRTSCSFQSTLREKEWIDQERRVALRWASRRRAHPQATEGRGEAGRGRREQRLEEVWRFGMLWDIHTLLGYNLDRAGQKIHYRRIFCH